MAAVVGLILLWHAQAIAGTAGLVVLTAVSAVITGVVVGRRRAPQLTGTVVSTALWTSVVVVLATAMDPLWMLAGVDDLALSYPAVFVGVAVVAWVMPSTGVHRGWTTVVGQSTMAATLPAAMWATGTEWRGLVVVIGLVAAFVLVGLRTRKVPAAERPRGWRRVLRGTTMGLTVAVLSMAALFASVPQANSIPFVSSGWNKAMCAIAAPDLANQPIGTGPEQLFSNINFGGAEAMNPPEGAKQPPEYADTATNFTRAGSAENYSLESYTLYETAGLRGVKWVNWSKDDEGEEDCGMVAGASVFIGNLVMTMNMYGLQTTIALKEWSQAQNPMAMLYDAANPIVAEVFTKFVAPMGGVMFILVGVAVMSRVMRPTGLRQGVSEAGGSLMVFFLAGFMYVGVAAGSYSNPNGNGFYMTAEFLDTTAAGLNNAFAEIVFGMINTDRSSMCQRPSHDGGSGHAVAAGQRLTSCLLAESLAYRPWAAGQFGLAGDNLIPTAVEATRFSDPRVDAEPAMDQGSGGPEEAGLPCYNNYPDANGYPCGDMRSYLIAQVGGPSINARIRACLDGDDDPDYDTLVRCEPYHAVAANLYYMADQGGGMSAAQASDIIAAYQGQGSFPHVSQAVVSLVGVAVTGIGLGSMAIITLMWHAWLWVLFVMGMFQLLWAAFPGKSKVAVEWVTNVLSTFAQRLLYGFAMTLMIWVISVVFAMQINLGLQILWTILVLFGTWMMISKIQSAAADKAPNMARYGKIAGAAPAVAAGYTAKKGVGAASPYVAAAAAKTAKTGIRATSAAGIGTARAGVAGTAALGRKAGETNTGQKVKAGVGEKKAQIGEKVENVRDRNALKTVEARARVADRTGSAGDMARAAGSRAVTAGMVTGGLATRWGSGGANYARGAVARSRDAMSMSTLDQMRGRTGAHGEFHKQVLTPIHNDRYAAAKARNKSRSEDRKNIREERAARARERQNRSQ